MIIYMQHKDHGNHIVYSESHAVECEKYGWVRVPFPTVNEEPSPEMTEIRRRGRPRKAD